MSQVTMNEELLTPVHVAPDTFVEDSGCSGDVGENDTALAELSNIPLLKMLMLQTRPNLKNSCVNLCSPFIV